jgi:hypothetical protein
MPRCSFDIVCLFHSKYERWELAETESLPVNSDPIISLVVDINIGTEERTQRWGYHGSVLCVFCRFVTCSFLALQFL